MPASSSSSWKHSTSTVRRYVVSRRNGCACRKLERAAILILWEIADDQPYEGQEEKFVDALGRIAAIRTAIPWVAGLA
jgi:hypothetical protein